MNYTDAPDLPLGLCMVDMEVPPEQGTGIGDRGKLSTGLACARVDCQHISSQSGYINIPCSQTTHAGARVRGGRLAIRCREACKNRPVQANPVTLTTPIGK